jgi:CheY-like chemotaxis protein
MRCFKPQTAYLSLFLAFLSVVFLLFVPLPVAAIDGENTKGSVTGKSSQNIQLTPREIQWLKTHKTVRVSGPGSFPPFRYFENGTVKGMASDYTLFLAEFIGLQIELEKNLPWPEILEKTREKKIDLLSCTAKTVERETYLLFSRPFLSFPLTEIMGQMLEKLGYQVISMTSPLDALKQFASDPDRIDLIITDMAMPAMTGEKLAREVMELRTDFPIIVATGYSKMMDERKAHTMGIKAVIMKPITMSVLARTVREVLDSL